MLSETSGDTSPSQPQQWTEQSDMPTQMRVSMRGDRCAAPEVPRTRCGVTQVMLPPDSVASAGARIRPSRAQQLGR